ncbi:EAL domain-containing protein [Enterobacter cloacae]|uniref:EAL domain-containing protein n=1 Tax=Enterobacter cloacae TaxID=550 RepID=UPI0034CD4F86
MELNAVYNSESIMDVTPFLQPIVNVLDGTLAGGEILCRVETNKGYILNQFQIEELEAPGRADFYARQLLLKTVEQLSRYNAIDRIPQRFFFTLNITASQIMSEAMKKEIVRFKHCFPSNIEVLLEIVERNVTDLTERIIDSIAFYHSIGVKIAIDDAGINSAAMRYFGITNVAMLKLDRSVTRINEKYELKHEKLINSIVSLSNFCDVKVIAEGVEDSNQQNALEDCGIYLMQGYYFSKPVSILDFCSFLNVSGIKG